MKCNHADINHIYKIDDYYRCEKCKNNFKKKQVPKCYNCKYSSDTFKVNGLTHLHCLNEDKYSKKDFEDGKWCAWDSLREFWDKCDKHEFKTQLK